VRLNRLTRDVTPAIFVKVEWYGATGSLKDRIYLHMFERAEARGDLKPGMQVLECSTGNAGIACAWVSAVKGYPCTIVMPEGMSDERKKIMRAYGAERGIDPARFALLTGDAIVGQVRPPKQGERYFSLARIDSVNGLHPDQIADVRLQLPVEPHQQVDRLLVRRERRAEALEPRGEPRAQRRRLEEGNQLLRECRRVRERIVFGIRLDEEVERIRHRHVGREVDDDVERTRLLGED